MNTHSTLEPQSGMQSRVRSLVWNWVQEPLSCCWNATACTPQDCILNSLTVLCSPLLTRYLSFPYPTLPFIPSLPFPPFPSLSLLYPTHPFLSFPPPLLLPPPLSPREPCLHVTCCLHIIHLLASLSFQDDDIYDLTLTYTPLI